MALLLTVLFYTTTLGLFLGFPFHYGRPSLLSKRVLPPGAEDCQEYLFWNKIKRAADDRVAEDERAQPNEDMQFGRSYYFNACSSRPSLLSSPVTLTYSGCSNLGNSGASQRVGHRRENVQDS